ncbi:MAG: putative porin [Lentisphaerae bacterium]|nr:putative porin [Lentisphaerota bacterium]
MSKKIFIGLLVAGYWAGLALAQDAAAPPSLPAWVETVRFSGDLRLRYDGTRAQDEPVRNRGSYRARLRAGAQVTEGLRHARLRGN